MLKSYLKFRKVGLTPVYAAYCSGAYRIIEVLNLVVTYLLVLTAVIASTLFVYRTADRAAHPPTQDYIRNQTEAERARDEALRLLSMCLNGGVLKDESVLLFCGRAVEQRGLVHKKGEK